MAKTQNEKKTRTFKAEIIAIIFFALMLLTGGSLVFFNKGDAGTFGLIGNNVSVVLFTLIGYSAYILPVLFGYLSYRFAFREGLALRISIPISLGLLIVASSGLFVLLLGSEVAGGLIGKIGANNLVHFVGLPGSIIILLAILLASLRVGTGISLISFFEKIFFGCRIIIIYGINAYKKIVGLIKAGKKSAETIKEARAEKKAKKEEKKEKEVKRKSPTIVTKPEAKPKKKPATAAQEKFEFLSPEGKFQLPHIDLMTPLPRKMDKVDKQSLLTNSKILEQKLVDFDVNGQVLAVRPGPVVTTYEFEPAPGIKVNKILNLADDLALAMRATSMRILAPIPGKAVVGIEVPNAIRESILLREMLESREFVKNKSKLALAFGKDISGETFVADLAKMPHLLVAGATGAGKSVFINTLILSILYKATPEDVRFLMVDPKMLELSAYEGIPHLLTPVVTDPKRATAMLKSIVIEMEKRYKLMSEVGAKNIDSYNEKVVAEPTHKDTEHKKLPFIVVIVDELADLMMTAGKDVEESLVRLSQMARAAGIHLVLATQRPSVDVITGIIKANFPARVSFQVPSRTDSRTILDSMGAETLLGQGDMLFMPPGSAKLSRLHGAFVSEEEIKRVTKYLKKQGKPAYDKVIAEAKAPSVVPGEQDYDEEFMERFDAAVKLVSGLETISTSYLQRRFRVGYNTAARIIEKMEQDGVVGPAQGSRPREVLKRDT